MQRNNWRNASRTLNECNACSTVGMVIMWNQSDPIVYGNVYNDYCILFQCVFLSLMFPWHTIFIILQLRDATSNSSISAAITHTRHKCAFSYCRNTNFENLRVRSLFLNLVTILLFLFVAERMASPLLHVLFYPFMASWLVVCPSFSSHRW